MSYSIIKKVKFNDKGVFISSASSNVYPRQYDEFRSEYYSDLMRDKGFTAVVRNFAEKMQAGEVKFLRGCKFNNAMLQAKSELERSVPGKLELFLNGETYGNYVATRVAEVYSGQGLSDCRSKLYDLQLMRSVPDAVFNMCKGNVEAFFYSDDSIQRNVDFCKRYVKEHAGELLFRIPFAVNGDKETALFAVSKCGCRFRDLDINLRDDPEVVLAAFGSVNSPEHLPDLISKRLQHDSDFMKKVIEVEPKLHFSRAKILLNNPDIVLKLAEKAAWINDFSYIPEEIRNAPPVQRALAARLHDEGLTEEQKSKRLDVLSKFVKPEYLVTEQLKDAVALEYKGIVFDDWAVDASSEGQGIWAEMCECCAEKYKDLISDELDDAGAVGVCSVKGCNIVGMDSDNEKHYYIDFKPELINVLTSEQLKLIEGTNTLDTKIRAAEIQVEKSKNSDVPSLSERSEL